MDESEGNIILLDKEPIGDLKERLSKKGSPKVVIIDSLMCLVGFRLKHYMELIDQFPTKLFIFICHEKSGRPDPAIGESIRRLSDVKIHVEGFKAFVSTRFAGEDGEGGEDFVIWVPGALSYWNDRM